MHSLFLLEDMRSWNPRFHADLILNDSSLNKESLQKYAGYVVNKYLKQGA